MSEPPDLEPGSRPPDLREARRRLAARSQELDLLQSMGRRAAEARVPLELFASVLELLDQTHELDLAFVCYEWDAARISELFLARPFGEEYIGAVTQRARRFLGWGLTPSSEPRRHELSGFDGARGSRRDFREQDLLLLPLIRRGQPAACLLVVPAKDPGEAQMRLLYSASNQLSLHLERIQMVREAEVDRFRAIVDAMPQGVLLTDRNLRVLQANRSAEHMLDSCSLGGSSTFEQALENLELGALVERARSADADTVDGEVRIPPDRTWSVTVSPVPGEDDSCKGLVLVLTDVTESRRLQRQLAQSEKMSSLGRMLSGVAHDLNNPLSSILGYAQLLKKSAPEQSKLRKHVSVMHREAERCRKIVQNLLSFARHGEPQRMRLSLNQVVRSTASLVREQLRADGARLEEDLSADLPAFAADAHQLEQMLVNLLTNAGHAVRQSGTPGVVTLRTRIGDGPAIVLDVADTGPGIPREVRSRIFEPFFTTKPPGEGTGLGLSMAYGTVTAHGGTIEVLERALPGTTLRITFPIGGS